MATQIARAERAFDAELDHLNSVCRASRMQLPQRTIWGVYVALLQFPGINRVTVIFATLFAITEVAQASTGRQVDGMQIGLIDGQGMNVVLLIAPATVGKCVGKFRGDLIFLNAAHGIPIAGTFVAGTAGCELPASIPWTALPEGAVYGARSDVISVRFRGERTEGHKVRKVNWSTDVPRASIQFAEPMKVALRRFASVADMHLGSLGLNTTSVSAEIVVRSPLRFHLRVLHSRFELEIAGKVVASGLKENFLIFGGRPNQVTFPVSVNNRAMLSATGSSLAKGAKMEGKLTGVTRLRFPGGDVDFPVELPVMISLR